MKRFLLGVLLLTSCGESQPTLVDTTEVCPTEAPCRFTVRSGSADAYASWSYNSPAPDFFYLFNIRAEDTSVVCSPHWDGRTLNPVSRYGSWVSQISASNAALGDGRYRRRVEKPEDGARFLLRAGQDGSWSACSQGH